MQPTGKDSRTGEGAGCITLLLSFAAIEGGIVLTAWALHGLLGNAAEHGPMLLPATITGVLLVFGGPQLLFRAQRAWPRITWQQLAASLPDLALAAWFVVGWAAPQVVGIEAAGILPGIMVLEFIIIHASVGLVAFPQQMAATVREPRWWNTPRAMTVWLLLLYSLVAAGISASVKSVWLFAGFWLLIGIKFIDDWLSPPVEAEERQRRHMARWSMSAALYLLLVFGSIFIPVPELGAMSASRGDGHWEQNPEQAVAMGAMYFILLAFCELYGAFNRVTATAGSSRSEPPGR